MIANVVIYYTVVLYIVCCAVLGYIDNNLKTGSRGTITVLVRKFCRCEQESSNTWTH